ncbi:AmmeMemoRadiSam system protein A [Biformimicrobium ophioploci]|uniref:AMMECR1 domain-containing protein n=1 Tax=Biformimicrobium ophioploci TaxID=3036711 RepID=A0ABQ6LXX6_9GAMM|nr:AmmeMemoRadiSam system protein A [Microbulbifer sp. NKW57]GMG86958.1 hypothetical protein MNKW57_12790 [Microbulbifer sp. NKW57]
MTGYKIQKEEQELLLAVAREFIESGVTGIARIEPVVAEYPVALQQQCASFVSIKRGDELRACLGTVEAHRPLVSDVASNAHAAASRDHRFAPLEAWELATLQVQISVLSSAQPMEFTTEEELLAQLRPGTDGLVLEAGSARSTFLPVVWVALPDPQDFLRQLKLKAGLPGDYFPAELRVSRYTTESFAAPYAS